MFFFVGETAERTTKVINTARGCTLLIDEAYQLVPIDASRDFGREAIETIMGTVEGSNTTEDNRPAYIFAGYPEEMDRFLETNSGLLRRVTNNFMFANYTIEELFSIFVKMAKEIKFKVNISLDCATSEMAACFPTPVCARYNAGIARELLAACKSSVNKRLVDEICRSSAAPLASLSNSAMLIKEVDFLGACRAVQSKICPK